MVALEGLSANADLVDQVDRLRPCLGFRHARSCATLDDSHTSNTASVQENHSGLAAGCKSDVFQASLSAQSPAAGLTFNST